MGKRLGIPVAVAIAIGIGLATLRGGSSFVLAETFDFAVAATSQLPTCVGDAHCVALCAVSPADGDWECFDNAGAKVTGMTQGVGMTYVSSFAHAPDAGFFQALNHVDDTSSAAAIPRINSAALRSLFAGDYTVIFSGFGTTDVDPNPQWWAMITDGTNQLQIRDESNAMTCLEKNGNDAQNGTARDGWNVSMCRRAGTLLQARTMGATSGGHTVAAQAAVGSSNAFFFGGGTGACCTPGGSMGGNIAWFAFYDEAKTDAWVLQTEKNWWGAPTVQSGGNGTVGTTTTSVIGRDDLAWGNGVSLFQQGAYITDPTLGLRHQSGFTNSWAADPLAAATWTDVGTPIITSNASAGPFFKWHNTNECDLIVDDDGAAFEGKRSATVAALDGGPGGWFNASCYAAQGTSGTTRTKLRISFTHDGVMDAGSATCDATGLDSTVRRYPLVNGCYAWIDGATSVQANILVGNATSDTGSVTSCQCQLSRTLFPESPTVDNTVKGSNWPELDGGGVPFGNAKGKLQAVFYPLFTSTQAGPLYTEHGGASGGIAQYVIDAYNNGASHDVLLSLTTVVYDGGLGDPGIQALMYGASATYENRFDIPYPFGPAVDAGQAYVFSYEWRPASGVLPDAGAGVGCRGVARFDVWTGANNATTIIAQNNGSPDTRFPIGANGQNSGALGTCPASTDVIDLGTRIQGTSPTSGWVRKLEIYR